MFETVYTSPVQEHLRNRIRRRGPITFHDWMETALYDSEGGYYCRNNKRWGREGDYLTSPGRSSLYAATFARYFAGLYDKLNRPERFTILEAGAGNGAFASGVLETLQIQFPKVFENTYYVVDEISEESNALARRELEPFAGRIEFGSMQETSIDAGIIFSNELLDAFPVHRVTMRDGELKEFYVGLDREENFVWQVNAVSNPRVNDHFSRLKLTQGQSAEVNLAVEDWLKAAANNVRAGYVVTVDYGASTPALLDPLTRNEGTLRGFRRHQLVDNILRNPGEQDLTTTINWTQVQQVGEKCGLKVVEFERQDKFLLANGILTQLEHELEHCETESEKLLLSTAAREMILPNGMAAHFQVMVQEKTR